MLRSSEECAFFTYFSIEKIQSDEKGVCLHISKWEKSKSSEEYVLKCFSTEIHNRLKNLNIYIFLNEKLFNLLKNEHFYIFHNAKY